MISRHAYLFYCALYAIAIAVPGPGIVAILARALRSGFRATIPAVIGTAVGDWILMSLSAVGLASLAHSLGRLFLVVRLAGAAYLLYLGYKYWTASAVTESDAGPRSAGREFLSQLTLTLGNPKAIVFFAALLPAAVDLQELKLAGYFQLSVATFVLIPAITLTYAALAARVRTLLTSRAARTRINKVAAVVMVGAGIGVAATS
jgi:threonine/homoserine/homoserine lactone efflux protein